MLFGYLLIPQTGSQRTAVDLSAPEISGNKPLDVIAKAMALKEDHHIGVQIFDATVWEFSDEISFTDFYNE